MGQSGQCITYEAVNQAYVDARKRISKYLNKNKLRNKRLKLSFAFFSKYRFNTVKFSKKKI